MGKLPPKSFVIASVQCNRKKNSDQKWSDDHGQFYYLLNFFLGIILTEMKKFVSFVRF